MWEPTTYDQLVERIYQWSNSVADVRMVMIIGSRARKDCPHDEWSDLDLVIVTNDPQRYIDQINWIDSFCSPLLTFLEPTAVGGFMERRVLFEGGMDVDFAIIPKKAFESGWTSEVESVFHRGVKVLVDKDGLAAYLPISESARHKPIPPDDKEVLERISEFFFQFIWCSKKLCRGELWSAKMCCDGVMKWQLLGMIEWHTRFVQSEPRDTWHKGRFFDRWVDSGVLKEVTTSFSNYDLDGVWSALFATKELFKRLAQEVGNALNCQVPIAKINSVETLVTSYYAAYQRNRQMKL